MCSFLSFVCIKEGEKEHDENDWMREEVRYFGLYEYTKYTQIYRRVVDVHFNSLTEIGLTQHKSNDTVNRLSGKLILV